MIRYIDIRTNPGYQYDNVFYIGRGSILGNPYTSIQNRQTKAEYIVSSREESINLFDKYIQELIENKDKDVCDFLNEIYKKAIKDDVYLACYCKPKPCHGDIIKRIIDSKFEKETPKDSGQFKMDL